MTCVKNHIPSIFLQHSCASAFLPLINTTAEEMAANEKAAARHFHHASLPLFLGGTSGYCA